MIIAEHYVIAKGETAIAEVLEKMHVFLLA